MGPTTYLYVPGDRPDRFAKAVCSGAEALILDLEDAVAVAAKDDARGAVVSYLAEAGAGTTELWVRVNVAARGLDDVAAIAGLPRVAGVVVPKATVAALRTVAEGCPLPLCALVESAEALLELPAIAAVGSVVALALGEVDLAADLRLEPSEDERELWPFRMQVVAAAVAHGCRPVGPVHTAIRDVDGLRSSTAALRRAGFGARQAVHPDQIEVIRATFAPSSSDVDRASALLAALEQASGGACIDADGRMIDEAVVRWARRTLDRARLATGGSARSG